MKKTKRMLSMLLSVVIALFSILCHVTIVNAEGGEVFQDENVRLVFEIVNSWDGGYQAELKLENLSDSVLNSWKIQMTSSDQINDFWGADLHTWTNKPENASVNVPENAQGNVSANAAENVSADMSDNVSENVLEDMSDNVSENVLEDMSDNIPENGFLQVYEITAFSYNNQIKPGESVSIGFIANGDGRDVDDINIEYQIEGEQTNISGNNVCVYEYYTVRYLITDQWEGNCNVKVEITNTSDEVIHNWGLRYLCADTVSGLYGASDVAEGRVHVFRNLGFNQDIAIGETVTYGYTQSFETTADIPEAFEMISTKQLVDVSDYEIEMIISDVWDNQMQANLVISNTGTEVIEDWSLSAVSNFNVVSIWNGELTAGAAGNLEIQNAKYTQNINPGESIFVGMIISCDADPVLENVLLHSINNKVPEQIEELEIVLIDLEESVIAVSEAAENQITIQTKGATGAEIRIYRKVEDGWEPAGQLHDDGNIKEHGDEIPNDGIYNNSVTMLASEAGEVLYKAELVKDGIVYDSAEFTIDAVNKLSDDEFGGYRQQISEINRSIVQCIESSGYEYGTGADEIVGTLENIYGSDVSVTGIESINGNTF